MGQSTDAILFYGYVWHEETSRPWTIGTDDEERENDDEDWEDRLARVSGLNPPEEPFPQRTVPPTKENGYDSTPKDLTPEERAIRDKYDAYRTAKWELSKKEVCEVSTHCSGECPMPFVCIKATKIVCSRGDSQEVTSLTIGPDWNEQLRVFCELMGIEIGDMKPGWYMVSDWC